VLALLKRERLYALSPAGYLLSYLFSHLPIMLGQPAFPAFAFRLAIVFPALVMDRVPQCYEAGTRLPFVRVMVIAKAQFRRSDGLDRMVDEFEYRNRRPERLPKVKVLQVPAHAVHAHNLRVLFRSLHRRLHPLLRLAEILRAGPLKAEDRLLVIAHGENGADLVAGRTLARKEIVDQRVDDAPLRFIGILCLVDEYMVELAIELVADPVACNLLLEQFRRAFNQIVKIQQPFTSLRRVPPQRKCAPKFERGSEETGEFEQVLSLCMQPDRFGDFLLPRYKRRVCLAWLLHRAWRTVLLQDGFAETAYVSCALSRFNAQPLADKFGCLHPGLRFPSVERRKHGLKLMIGENLG